MISGHLPDPRKLHSTDVLVGRCSFPQFPFCKPPVSSRTHQSLSLHVSSEALTVFASTQPNLRAYFRINLLDFVNVPSLHSLHYMAYSHILDMCFPFLPFYMLVSLLAYSCCRYSYQLPSTSSSSCTFEHLLLYLYIGYAVSNIASLGSVQYPLSTRSGMVIIHLLAKII